MTENPEWIMFSCQDCVRKYPYLKKLITPAAESVIEKLCSHKVRKNDGY
jgi:hypothetical protein